MSSELLVVVDSQEDWSSETVVNNYDGSNVRVIGVGEEDEDAALRGYSPDHIVLMTELSDRTLNLVLEPMTAVGDCEIVELYD